jgi:hypothetical protein
MNWIIDTLSEWWNGTAEIENQLLNLRSSIKTLNRSANQCKRIQKQGKANMLRCFGKDDIAAAEIYAKAVVQAMMDEQTYLKMAQSAEKVYNCIMAAHLSGNTNINLVNALNTFCESTQTDDPMTIQQNMSALWENSIQNNLLREDTLQPAGNMIHTHEVHNLMKMIQDEMILKQSSMLPHITYTASSTTTPVVKQSVNLTTK